MKTPILTSLSLLTLTWTEVHSFQSPVTYSKVPPPLSRPQTTANTPQSTTSTQLEALPAQLQAIAPLTSLASSPLGAISVLAGIVVVHEAGHYLAARSLQIQVEEFSVGFGPKIWGFQAFGNPFNLRALPLGGYVRFPEHYNATQYQALQEQVDQAQQARQANWTAAEQFRNAVTLGQWDRARRQQEARALTAAETQMSWWKKLLRGGTNSKASAPSSILDQEIQIDYYDDPNLLQNRNWFQRSIVLSMGVIFNMILAWALYFGQIQYGPGIPKPVFDSGVTVQQSPSQNAPSSGVLQKGDVIIGINGRFAFSFLFWLLPHNSLALHTGLQLSTKSSSSPIIAQQQVSDTISRIRQTPNGEQVHLQVLRDGQSQELDILPTQQDPKTIGVLLGPNVLKVQQLSSDSAMKSASMAYHYLIDTIVQTFQGLTTVASQFLMGKGSPPGQQLSGPIGLIKTGSDVVSTRDWSAVAMFAAALSVNLGVLNALPLPALDGGLLVFCLAEALTGRKVDDKLQEGITGVAVLLLVLLSITTAFSDIGSIVFGR